MRPQRKCSQQYWTLILQLSPKKEKKPCCCLIWIPQSIRNGASTNRSSGHLISYRHQCQKRKAYWEGNKQTIRCPDLDSATEWMPEWEDSEWISGREETAKLPLGLTVQTAFGNSLTCWAEATQLCLEVKYPSLPPHQLSFHFQVH